MMPRHDKNLKTRARLAANAAGGRCAGVLSSASAVWWSMDAPQPRARQPADAEAPEDPGAENLLPRPVAADGAPPRPHPAARSVPWVTVLGFSFLSFNSGMAIYRSQGEPGAVGFVVFSYLDLLLLFSCLRWYETAEPGSVARDRLKAVIWVLTTALTLVFTTKVAAVMPAVVAVVVWLMAFATIGGGFVAFFLCGAKG